MQRGRCPLARFKITSPMRINMGHYLSRTVGQSTSDWVKALDGDNTFDVDADGVLPTPRRILCDVTQALSQRLGRQMPMMAVYNINYIRVDMVNVDDTNDNDTGAEFNGRVNFWTPSKHRVAAMQLARQVERADEDRQIDGDSFLLSTDRDYAGMRFNWDADGQTQYATSEAISGYGSLEWDLQTLFDTYDLMVQDRTADYTNALWANGRTGYPEQIGFSVAYHNKIDLGGTNTAYKPQGVPFEFVAPYKQAEIECLGGLLHIEVENSSVDDPNTTIDDDYNFRITIGVTGWQEVI